jgi:hypothetical protein
MATKIYAAEDARPTDSCMAEFSDGTVAKVSNYTVEEL